MRSSEKNELRSRYALLVSLWHPKVSKLCVRVGEGLRKSDW